VTDPAPEVALTAEEVQEILSLCGPQALLVGGQALALWAVVYEVTPPEILAASISSDADFVGNAEIARKLGRSLKHWDFWRPKLDDATVQTAKLTRTVADGIKQIDFLGGIAGLDTEAIQRRAVTLTLTSGTDLRVLHPLDVLESRLQNLLLIPEKRHPGGIAQAQLAISIARGFLNRLLDEGAGVRLVFDAIERIAQIASKKALTGVMLDYSLDVLSAVPFERMEHPPFQTKRWPKIVQEALNQRSGEHRKDGQRTNVS
jgi:hypothetical protein